MSRPTYIFAGGGTGGHLYPALAVAEQLLEAKGDAAVVFACSNRPIDRRVLASLDYAMVPQPIRPLPRRLRSAPGFLLSWWRSRKLARTLLRDLKPAAVLGTGGFAAAPLVKEASKAAIRTAMLNPDAVPGKANKYLGKYVDVVFTQFDSTTAGFAPDIAPRVRTVGCPIRRGFAQADRNEAIEHFSLDPGRKTLLVNGGSQGAATINEAVAMLDDDLGELADSWQMLHVTGLSQVTEVTDPTPGQAIPSTVLNYCDRMDLAYAVADLALCRGGASTAAELAASRTPAIIMPYPYHADEHQRLNAAPLEECGAAIICTDAAAGATNARMLREHLIVLMSDSDRLESMRTSAASMARPNAAKDVADWMLGS
ncbi:MAG: UDP-N-acetylglucosamine--N-acetylmuramyl-(pentapeptide) pyrophosphoryl-undecaprenol N-acetylglucosamine transferase [Phycisphaerae bacterium]|nr:UDP-N-acetylglucosamine--N-acetylmuramyl-(pentapeptide) pyrophosphoryl-undecaprenol N-acetylglucosamine transferase [Phycisphaerae bacterium]